MTTNNEQSTTNVIQNKPKQSQSPPGQGWGLKVANDVNYHLRCLKNLSINLTRTRVYAGVKKS